MIEGFILKMYTNNVQDNFDFLHTKYTFIGGKPLEMNKENHEKEIKHGEILYTT